MPQPVLNRVAGAKFQVDGLVGRYLKGVSDQWLKIAPYANAGILEILHDRDRKPPRNMVPWAGEFAGKYLTGAVQVLRLTGEAELRNVIEEFVRELLLCQDDSGYIGPWARGHHLTGRSIPEQCGSTWDTWGHYHAMLGLLLWHQDSGDAKALAAARRIGDLLCEMFLGPKRKMRMVDTGSTEMNLAPIHSLCLLHKAIGGQKYVDLALQVLDEFAAVDASGAPLAGDYFRTGVDGREFFDTPRPRWESLHPMMGMVELYYITGDERCCKAFEHHGHSMTGTDRHNNGGFTSGEQAQGQPFHLGAIETCCTIAYMAYSVEMLRLTGDSKVADELELSMINSIVGAFSCTGRWATYDTPMDGVRRASAHSIVFQSREGTPELNCCSVNAARGFGFLSDWAVMADAAGLVVNYYGPGAVAASVKGVAIKLTQATEYPRDGRIAIKVSPARGVQFALKLRIPRWSAATKVKVNGQAVKGVQPGQYLVIDRKWAKGDAVQLDLDMSFHYWIGDKDCAGKTSLYRGPVLLTYDRRYNEMDPIDLPMLRATGLKGRFVQWKRWLPPAMLMEFTAADGRKIRLCDHGSAGEGGTPYVSWLPIDTVGAAIRQPFASDVALLAKADLIRFDRLHTGLLDARAKDLPRTDGRKYLAMIDQVQAAHGRFVTDLATARAVLARCDRTTPAAAELARMVARFDADERISQGNLGEALAQVRRDVIHSHPEWPVVANKFQAAKAIVVEGEITLMPLPAQDVVFVAAPVTGENFADIRTFHGGRQGVVYIRTNIHMIKGGPGQLAYGADGPVRVWVNGQPAGAQPAATNPAVANQFSAPVHWNEGDNAVLFALDTNHGRAWGVYATGVLA